MTVYVSKRSRVGIIYVSEQHMQKTIDASKKATDEKSIDEYLNDREEITLRLASCSQKRLGAGKVIKDFLVWSRFYSFLCIS